MWEERPAGESSTPTAARMAYAEGQTDLSLRLYDGSIHQYRPAEPTRFQLTYFAVNDIRVKNVYDQLQRNTRRVHPGRPRDEHVRDARGHPRFETSSRRTARDRNNALVVKISGCCSACLGSSSAPGPRPPRRPPPLLRLVQVFPESHSTQDGQGAVQCTAASSPRPTQSRRRQRLRRSPPRSRTLPLKPRVPSSVPAQGPGSPAGPRSTSAVDRVREADRRADRYAVEVHKKWAISLACVSFVIVGHRDGAAVSPGGDRPGDRGRARGLLHSLRRPYRRREPGRPRLVSPWVAMWTPNIVLTVLGILGLVRVSRETGSTRGGDFQEILDGVRHLFRRLAADRSLARRLAVPASGIRISTATYSRAGSGSSS